MKRSYLKICLALVLTFYFSACTPVSSKPLRVAVATSPATSGDPFSRYTGGAIKSAVFDGLTALSGRGQVSPAIAVEWEAVNETEWVFELRDDVLFHNGRSVSAEIIAKELDYLLSVDAQRHWMAQQFKGVISVHAPDSVTLILKTAEPDPLIPRKLSLLRVIDIDYWRDIGEQGFMDAPVGTGPFRLDSWGVSKSSATLKAVKHPWRNSKEIRTVQYDVVPDSSRRLQALLSGEMDIVINLDVDAISTIEASGFKVALVEQPIVLAIGFRTIGNSKKAVLNPDVRQALNYAINKAQISKYILSDVMAVADQGTTSGVLGHNANLSPFSYDKEKARALLASAGYENGLDLTIAVTIGQVPGDALVYQQVAQDLLQVGVDVELQQIPFLELSRRLTTGDWDNIDMISTVWSSLNLYDSGQALGTFSCDRPPAPFFCDRELDSIAQKAERARTISERAALLEDAMARAMAIAPSIFLVNYTSIVGMTPSVKGYGQRSDGILFENIVLRD